MLIRKLYLSLVEFHEKVLSVEFMEVIFLKKKMVNFLITI